MGANNPFEATKDDMRRLRNHLIGVEQGSKTLFSDFEGEGIMWAGYGPREKRYAVVFRQEFKTIPTVHVSLTMWDMDQQTNQRADISAENIGLSGFDVVFKTWGDTKIARVRATWFVIGEVKGNDEWDLY